MRAIETTIDYLEIAIGYESAGGSLKCGLCLISAHIGARLCNAQNVRN
jgi:hypothetical protein